MTYITKFSITASPLTAEQYGQIDAALEERGVAFDLEDKQYANQTGFWSSKYDTWDDHEADLLAISRLFPDVRFELDGEGDDRDDVWCKYFIGGKTCCCGTFTVSWPFIESDLKEPAENCSAPAPPRTVTPEEYLREPEEIDVFLFRSMLTLLGQSEWEFQWNPDYIADVKRLIAGYLTSRGHAVKWHRMVRGVRKTKAQPAEAQGADSMADKMAAYETFKLRWMLDHGHTLADLLQGLDNLREDGDGSESIQDLFNLWERSCGFGSAVWPCYREFLECECLETQSAPEKEG